MFFVRSASMALLCLAVAGCGTPPPPANMPPPLPASASAPVSPDMYSGIIEQVGEVTLASAPVDREQTFLTIPFTYRNTAVLTEDVKGFSITVGGTLAPAGAPGYFAGSFSSFRGGSMSADNQEMWCFLRPAETDGEERDPLCLLRDMSGVAAIAPTRLSPFIWSNFAPMTGTFDYAHTPIFEVREVELPLSLALEHRFAGWDEGVARVEVYVRDKQVRTLRSSPRADGRQIVETLAGELLLESVAGRPDAVRASLIRQMQRN